MVEKMTHLISTEIKIPCPCLHVLSSKLLLKWDILSYFPRNNRAYAKFWQETELVV